MSPVALMGWMNCWTVMKSLRFLPNGPLGDTIEAKIQTYLYGDGETVRADEEDLAFFREHFDELDASDALDCISGHSFSFESDELDFGYGEESEDEEDLEP